MIYGWVIDLGELLVVFLILIMIEAFFLKTSCALFNLLVGVWTGSFSSPAPSTSQSVPQTEITTEPRAVRTLKDDETPLPNIEIPLCVPKPSFEWAMCIVFAAGLVNALAFFLLVRVLRLAGMSAGFTAIRSLPMQLIFCPLSFLIHCGMYAAMLPTSFGKGFLISLIALFLNLIAAVFLLILIALGTIGVLLWWLRFALPLIAAVLLLIFFLIALTFNLGVPRLDLWA